MHFYLQSESAYYVCHAFLRVFVAPVSTMYAFLRVPVPAYYRIYAFLRVVVRMGTGKYAFLRIAALLLSMHSYVTGLTDIFTCNWRTGA